MSLNESDDIAQSKQRIGGIFGRAAPTYEQVGPQFFSHFGKRLVDIAKISPGSKVLDLVVCWLSFAINSKRTNGSLGVISSLVSTL